MMGFGFVLFSPMLVMLLASRLVDFHRRWQPRIAVVMAAAVSVIVALVFTGGMAFFLSPLVAFYGLVVGGITHAVVRPR